MPTIFDSLQLGAITLPNRILLAPLTRCRATPDHVPTDLMTEYYTQRADAGLVITECTMILPGTSAFGTEPGIYSPEQIAAWRKVTDSVHAKGGHIFLQIWHCGRATHPLMNDGLEPVAPSALAISNDHIHTREGKKPYPVPRALNADELPSIVAAFAQAARNAREAGFDGVEVHGANGYLLDEFLRDGANQRTDEYGGSVENRARLLLEVMKAVCDAWSPDRVGIRVSPLNSYNDMRDSDPVTTYRYVAEQLDKLGIAYLHVMEGDFFQLQKADVMPAIRAAFHGNLIGNFGYTADTANQALAEGRVEAVAFGSSFLANPDLVTRFRKKAPLNAPDSSTFYSPGPKGYTDYPTLEQVVA